MQDWLAATAAVRPDAVALAFEGRTWTYRTLNEDAARLCGRLLAHNVGRGALIGVLMANCAEYVQLIHALARIGAVLVPLNARLTAGELAYQIALVNCGAVIYAPEMAEKVAAIATKAIPLKELAVGDDPIPREWLTGTIDLDAVQCIAFTSGTSGKPKAAQLTFGNFFHGANASAWRLGTLPDDRWLAPMPLYHVGGLAIVWRCCLYGTALILESGFDLDRMGAIFDSQSITLVSLVPTMLHRLLEADVAFPSSLRLVLLGGAAATPDLIARCAARHIPIATTYGLTETASQFATQLPADTLRKPGSVGKPLTFNTVTIVDADGRAMPPNEWGEVVVRGPTVMRGYFGLPDDRALRDGAFRTGDIGYLDTDGDLWIVQRRSDLIVSGGENVYPAEVEAILAEHPTVAEVCVVGVPDVEWGQIVAAAIVLRPDAVLSLTDLHTFCERRLAGYKRPRHVDFLTGLTQTASGKVDRRRVAELIEKSLGFDTSAES